MEFWLHYCINYKRKTIVPRDIHFKSALKNIKMDRPADPIRDSKFKNKYIEINFIAGFQNEVA